MKKPTSRALALAASSVLVLGSLSAAVNDVFDVYTAVELTNACAQATFNFNTIRVHPGVYVGCYECCQSAPGLCVIIR